MSPEIILNDIANCLQHWVGRCIFRRTKLRHRFNEGLIKIADDYTDAQDGHCFLFDKENKGVFSFKAVGYTCTREVSESNEYAELAKLLVTMKTIDPKLEFISVGLMEEVDL